MICVDSFGWIERFSNGPNAEAYNRVFDRAGPSDILTSVVSLYEVYKKVRLATDEPSALEAVAAMGQTRVVPLTQQLALEAADFSIAFGLHFADAVIYATARAHGAKLYTSDRELRGKPSVIFV